MKPILLVDFGSTNTKVTAADVDACRILGTATAYTTVETDINEGLSNALKILEETTGPLQFQERYACSSAAGGLKMISIGLVPELTAQASREASLGAGAKVWKTYSFNLTKRDMREIEAYHPDIILLTGGTDGGNQECILYNGKMLSELSYDCPIVIAGNRCAADECEEILEGRSIFVCDNVMPKLGELNIEPTQKQIREIFLKRIVQGKGLSKASDLVSGIIMPTPSAMLAAMELLADGRDGLPGIGLAKVSLQQTSECLAVTSLVAGHLMNGVMDCVKVCSLSSLGQINLAGGSAVLSLNTHLKVLLGGIGNNLAQKLCKLGSMLSLFVSSLLIVQADLRISLSVSNSCHCQIHTNLRALAFEVCSQISDDVLADTLCNTYYMLSSPGHLAFLLLCKFLSGSAANRALLRSCIAFINITTNSTYKLCHSFFSFTFYD